MVFLIGIVSTLLFCLVCYLLGRLIQFCDMRNVLPGVDDDMDVGEYFLCGMSYLLIMVVLGFLFFAVGTVVLQLFHFLFK